MKPCPDILPEQSSAPVQISKPRKWVWCAFPVTTHTQPYSDLSRRTNIWGDLPASLLDYPEAGWSPTPTHTCKFPSLDTQAASLYPKVLLVGSAPPGFPWLQVCSLVISLINVLPHGGKPNRSVLLPLKQTTPMQGHLHPNCRVLGACGFQKEALAGSVACLYGLKK